MSKVLWLYWILFLIPRIVVWPILWYDMRQRRLGRKADEWHKIDAWLVDKGHVVRTYGYFFWEKKAKICTWCIALWVLFFALITGGYYV